MNNNEKIKTLEKAKEELLKLLDSCEPKIAVELLKRLGLYVESNCGGDEGTNSDWYNDEYRAYLDEDQDTWIEYTRVYNAEYMDSCTQENDKFDEDNFDHDYWHFVD